MNETAGPRQGMVMDFSEIKEIVHEEVLKVYDHAVVLNEEDPLCAVMRRNGIAELFHGRVAPGRYLHGGTRTNPIICYKPTGIAHASDQERYAGLVALLSIWDSIDDDFYGPYVA